MQYWNNVNNVKPLAGMCVASQNGDPLIKQLLHRATRGLKTPQGTFFKNDSRKLTICCPCRGGECDPDHSHVGGQHSTEAAGGKVQKRRPPSDPVQRHIWCVI